MRFHSRWGKKSDLKAQKCSKFHRRDVLHDRVFELIMTQKRKRELFPTSFEVNLSAVILSIMLRADFNFELILYITILVFLSPGSCFKSAICIQNSFESAAIVLFSPQSKEGKIIHQKGLRASFTLIFHSKATLTSIYVFPFHFKCQRSKLSVLGMKTRLWKFVDLGRNAPWLTALFERVILRQKTVFPGPLKSSKNMRRKPTLIGLFVLNNNRTIGGPK